MIKLAIVVPCYNEEAVLTDSAQKLIGVINELEEKKKISEDSFILFVDDGSRDTTWDIIIQLNSQNKHCKGLKLATNVGHQNALLAGLMTIKDEVDASLSIDADLQDDIACIELMVDKYAEGNEIVYGVRDDRSSDSWFKRTTAQGFYKFMNMLGVKIVYNHADFRLMGKQSLQGLAEYKERNLFLRGVVPLIGYKTATVSYERKERLAGESKYPLKKMMAFAFDGVTSFSIKPINFILYAGVIMVIFAVVMAIYSLYSYAIGRVVSGWTSLMLSLWMIGGMLMCSLGIVGEYIGKIYMEVKERPRYIVQQRLD